MVALMRIRPTPMQDAIVEFLTDYKRLNDGNSPTYQEIAEALGKRPANIYRYVQGLVKKGVLGFTPNKAIILIGGQYIPPEHITNGSAERKQRIKEHYNREDVIRKMYKSQKGKCWWCGCDLLGVHHIDHRVPLAKGGTDEVGNLCLACPDCNYAKSDKMPHEFNGRLL